jgi:hypothetical protein
MTQTIATYESAPRNLEELIKTGRFTLRSLGAEIPAWDNEDERHAFLKMTTEQQAAAVLKSMLERDKKEKGGGSKSAAAATETPKTSTRTPSNKSASKASEAAAAPSGGGDVGGNVAALLTLLNELKAGQDALEQRVTEVLESNAALQAQLAGNNKLAQVSVSLALQMSEQVLNQPGGAVLEAAIEQLSDIADQLAEIVEPAQDADEGNG